jgi:hypothetical protein
MIIYGTRGKVIPGGRRQDIVCASCGQADLATYGILRYFHIFWIPVLPTKKQPVAECLHCKKTLAGKEIPEPARTEITRAVFTTARTAPICLSSINAVPSTPAYAPSGVCAT